MTDQPTWPYEKHRLCPYCGEINMSNHDPDCYSCHGNTDRPCIACFGDCCCACGSSLPGEPYSDDPTPEYMADFARAVGMVPPDKGMTTTSEAKLWFAQQLGAATGEQWGTLDEALWEADR